jgi:hypothetical protein
MYVLLWEPITEVSSAEWLIVGVAAVVDIASMGARFAKASRPYG